MLEIYLMVTLSKKIGGIATNKGRSAAGFIVLLIGLWLLGEFCGAIVGTVGYMILTHSDKSPGLAAYPVAILLAAGGAFAAFAIAKAQAPLPGSPDAQNGY